MSAVHTFTNNTPTAIKDKGTITSTISVPDGYLISTVTLNITHTRDEDLDVFLIAPDGTRVQLFTDVGGTGDNFTGTTLRRSRADTSDHFRFRPVLRNLSPGGLIWIRLCARSVQGTWKLEVTDDTKEKPARLTPGR